MENVVIIGSGPAAYTAAMSVLSFNPILFEGEIVGDVGPGGQLTTTTYVDNYPGFPNGVQGPELMSSMREHAQESGIKIISKTVTSITKENGIFNIVAGNNAYKSRSIIIATGASAKRLYAPGTREGEYWQKGISACAVCDGFFYEGMDVAVIGGGDSAMEETIYLSNIAKKVYLIHRRAEFRARADKLEKVKSIKNVEIITPAVLVSAHGDEVLKYIKLENKTTNEVYDLNIDGLFFAIGHNPNTKFLNGMLKLDDLGYIQTDKWMHTSVDGCFACGDVQDYVYRQAITASSSGYIAGIEAKKYLNGLNK